MSLAKQSHDTERVVASLWPTFFSVRISRSVHRGTVDYTGATSIVTAGRQMRKCASIHRFALLGLNETHCCRGKWQNKYSVMSRNDIPLYLVSRKIFVQMYFAFENAILIMVQLRSPSSRSPLSRREISKLTIKEVHRGKSFKEM